MKRLLTAQGRRQARAAPSNTTPATSMPRASVAKVSHTLDVDLADRLEEFAFRQRFSESAVIEFALRRFFEGGADDELGGVLRQSGAGRRRKT